MAKRIKLLRPKRPKTRQQWATYIGNCWHHAVEGVIETGRMLIDAQDNLEHGEFLPMVKNDLPFGEDTAQRLMALARHPVISNAAHARHLPPHWMTLFEMTRLPPKEVADRIANGTINNKTTRKQVRDLRVAATATKATEKKGNVVPLTTKPLPTNVATSKVDLTPPPATVDARSVDAEGAGPRRRGRRRRARRAGRSPPEALDQVAPQPARGRRRAASRR